MKDREVVKAPKEELVAQFGEASLIRVAGRLYLRGGPMSDRVEALEWLARFMPEAPVQETPDKVSRSPAERTAG